MGLRPKVQRELAETALPEDLRREFHALAEWARTLPARFGGRVEVRLVDAASLEGFAKSLVGRIRRYPAFRVGREWYAGADLARVDALIAGQLTARPLAEARPGPGAAAKGA